MQRFAGSATQAWLYDGLSVADSTGLTSAHAAVTLSMPSGGDLSSVVAFDFDADGIDDLVSLDKSAGISWGSGAPNGT